MNPVYNIYIDQVLVKMSFVFCGKPTMKNRRLDLKTQTISRKYKCLCCPRVFETVIQLNLHTTNVRGVSIPL